MLGFPVFGSGILLDVIDYLNYVFTPFNGSDIVLVGDVAQFDQSKVAYTSHVHFLVAMWCGKTGFSLTGDIVRLLLEFVNEIIK